MESNITAAGAVDREFFDILTPQGCPKAPPDPPKALPELPQTLPKLLQGLPELTQRPAVPPEVPGADSGGVRALKCDAGALKQDFGNCPRQPAAARRSPVIRCHGLRLGTTLPHAPGVRMT